MKQSKAGRLLICAALALLFAAAAAPAALANSAQPPMFTVIVPFPPDDLMLSLRFTSGSVIGALPLEKTQKAWEAYYRFFYWMADPEPSFDGVVLVIRSNEYNFECPLPESVFKQYFNSFVTLDLASESVSPGQSPLRQPLLISMHVILTLLIEGLVFFAFGYRRKASWIAFFAVNLVTQGALNILLSGFDPYWPVAFVFLEILIFIAEAIAFAFLLDGESTKLKAVGFALTANTASLILGGLLLTFLPF